MKVRVTQATYLMFVLMMTALLIAGTTFVAFLMINVGGSKSRLYAELDDEGVIKSGVNLIFPRTKPITAYVVLTVPTAKERMVGPSTVIMYVNGAKFLESTCPQRLTTETNKIVLCSITLPHERLPSGNVNLELFLKQAKIDDNYIPTLPVMTIQGLKTSEGITLYSVRTHSHDLAVIR